VPPCSQSLIALQHSNNVAQAYRSDGQLKCALCSVAFSFAGADGQCSRIRVRHTNLWAHRRVTNMQCYL